MLAVWVGATRAAGLIGVLLGDSLSHERKARQQKRRTEGPRGHGAERGRP